MYVRARRCKYVVVFRLGLQRGRTDRFSYRIPYPIVFDIPCSVFYILLYEYSNVLPLKLYRVVAIAFLLSCICCCHGRTLVGLV